MQWLFFDLDGTIIDTEPVAAATGKELLAAMGIQLTQEDARLVSGRTWHSALTLLYARHTFPQPFDTTFHSIRDVYRARIESNLVVVPGSIEAIQELSKTYKMACVSGSRRSEITWALEHIDVMRHFSFILGCEDYTESKPNPESYLLALNRAQCTAQDAIVFEDSAPGIAAGIAAGIQVVCITSTNHFGQDTQSAHLHVPDFRSVTPQLLASLKN